MQGLERIKAGTNDEAADGLQLLKHATEICINLGDAWYYRSIFEKKLGQASQADYSLRKAKMFGSEAMDQAGDPFQLATGGGAKPKIGPVREKWALIIGISQFEDTQLKPLAYTSKDARDFADLLLDPNVGRFEASHVHALTTGHVTTSQLKQELNWLARSAGEDDLVVLFLASHGTPRNYDTAEVNYIATSDTKVTPPDDLFATSLPMVDLSDIVRTRVKSRRTVIILDTCHSGAATTSLPDRAAGEPAAGAMDSSASPVALDRIRQGFGRVILTSSKPDEVSSEGAPFENGYFTHFLLQALRQNNGNATMDDVYAYMSQQLPKAAQAVRRRQTPVFTRSDLGAEIVIGAPVAAGTALRSPAANRPTNRLANTPANVAIAASFRSAEK